MILLNGFWQDKTRNGNDARLLQLLTVNPTLDFGSKCFTEVGAI